MEHKELYMFATVLLMQTDVFSGQTLASRHHCNINTTTTRVHNTWSIEQNKLRPVQSRWYTYPLPLPRDGARVQTTCLPIPGLRIIAAIIVLLDYYYYCNMRTIQSARDEDFEH